jgi:prevent-host-death family protein
MSKATATQVKNSFGKYMDSSKREPVIIEKSGRNEAVLVSFEEFERLSEYEDLYWGRLAEEASKSGFLGPEKTMERLSALAKKAGIDVGNDA